MTRQTAHRLRRKRRGLCVHCGRRQRLKPHTRCAGCHLRARLLIRMLRLDQGHEPTGAGRRPLYTDAELRAMARREAWT